MPSSCGCAQSLTPVLLAFLCGLTLAVVVLLAAGLKR